MPGWDESEFDVSVIIPMYHAETTLTRCVESIAKQGVREILLVDDGSADGTVDAAENLARQYPTVRVLQNPHGGVSAARNRGIREARGTWILFLDADDTLAEKGAETLWAGIREETDACLGGILRGNERPFSEPQEPLYLSGHKLMDHVLTEPTDRLTVHGWVFRRSVCMENDVFFREDLKLGEDSEWVLRMLAFCHEAAFVEAPVYRYTLSGESTIHRWKTGQTGEYLKTLKAISETEAARETNWPIYVLVTLLLILTHDTFHPGNPAGLKAKLSEAGRLRHLPVFDEALAKADLRDAGRARRMVWQWMKAGRYRLVYLAVRIRQWQNARRAEG